MNRTEAVKQSAFENDKIDGVLFFNSSNLTWLTGFCGASAMLIPRAGESVVYVYGVNHAQAEVELSGFKVELVKHGENIMDKIAKQTSPLQIKRLIADVLNVESWRSLSKLLGSEKTLEVDNRFLRELRKVKDEYEIKMMRKAADLTSCGMRVAGEVVAAGVKEYEVAAEIEYAMRKQGSYGIAFETIVASGLASAFPHGGCSDRKIQKGNFVVVDMGATYKLYRSDMTRTFVAGKPSAKQKKLYEVVKAAQEKAVEAMKPNVEAKDVDAAARKVIAGAGYGDQFVHSLGHGVGLDIHEPPTLSPDSEDVLAAGNVVTVEPGIYLVGYGGVRIEDTVLVQKNGAEKLTNGPCALREE
jgi:Xaa-Pro dipeptidase